MKKYLIIFLALVSFLSCRKNPKAPKWDTNITIPLAYDRYPVIDITDTTESGIQIWFDQDSIMTLYFKADIDTFSLAGSLKINDFDTLISKSIADMWVTNLKDTASVCVGVGEILDTTAPDIIIPLIPPSNYTTGFKIDTLENIDSLTLCDAYLRLIVDNYTGMSFDSINFIPIRGLCFQDTLYFTDIGQYKPYQEPGWHQEKSIHEENVTVKHIIEAQQKFVWSAQDSVHFSTTDSVVFRVVFDSVKFWGGRVKAPSITDSISDTSYFPFEFSYLFDLDSIGFSEGDLIFETKNSLPIGADIEVKIEELNESFESRIGSDSITTDTINLEGLTFDNHSAPLGKISLTLKVIATTDSSKDWNMFESTQSVETRVSFENLAFDFIAGEFMETATYSIEGETFDMPVDYGDIDCFRFAKSDLCIDIWNTIGFTANIKTQVIGKNSYGDSVSIPITVIVSPGDVGSPIHSDNSTNLAPLLNILPEEIIISGKFELPPGEGFIRNGSWITGKVESETPFKVAFVADTVYFKDTTDIKEDIGDYISNIQSAYLKTNLKNHFPFGFTCDFVVEKLGDASSHFSKRIIIPPAPVNAEGIAISCTTATITVSLDSSEISLFQRIPLIAYPILYVPETDTITIHARDYVEFGAYCVFTVRIGK
ncbi:hypothetical protein KAW65_09165 [candidate division WOR-3 bacterium]|nr:hypothetical protein [candidate division WOR-3 bacterium]